MIQMHSLAASARLSSNRLLACIAVAGMAAVGIALISQHVYGMQPCAWCVLPRLAFLAIAVSCGLALLARSLTARVSAHVVAVGSSVAGIAAALWQHFMATTSTSCALSLADRAIATLGLDHWIPSVFAAQASCADSATTLMGAPYEFWSLALFVLAAGALLLSILLCIAEYRSSDHPLP